MRRARKKGHGDTLTEAFRPDLAQDMTLASVVAEVAPDGMLAGVVVEVAPDRNPEEQGRSTVLVSAPPLELVAGAMPPSRAPLAPGSVVKHYEILRELGQGGMGSVFLARDTRLARLCAIKLLLAYSGGGVERFLAEARATARCKHENIVVIHEVDEIRGYPYMVLEYVEGRTLRAWMAERSRPRPFEPEGIAGVEPSLAVELMMPIVRALACAHEMGIVHRDLKPENVLLTDAGQVKVVDFGIAKRIGVGEAASTPLATQACAAGDPEEGIGTPAYMSPEQWLRVEVDHQSDLWAAGLILYELCIGSHPLAPATMTELRKVQDLDVPMPSVRTKRPDLGALGAVIDRCLKKRKAERIGSARELLSELEPLLNRQKALVGSENESPFAGLSAFQESDAARFFGRDRDIAAVLGRLRHQQLVVIAGPSGAGKSSFVRAGVIPALKRTESWGEAFIVRPGRRPLAELADVLAQIPEIPADTSAPAAADKDGSDATLDSDATLRSRPGYLGARLRAHCHRSGSGHRVLLFVDQFEELYTLGAGDGERAAFLACLAGVADDASSPLRVVLAIRSDFLDRMAGDYHFMTEVTRGLVFLAPMGREGLRDALTKPVDATGYRFEDDLVEQMLEALQSARSPLPLLEFTAAKLWDSRDRERRRLTHDSYRMLGGVAGALSTHADAVLSALSPVERRIARWLLPRLVTPERTRAIVGMAELCAIGEGSGTAEQVVQRLAGARLLHIETGGDGEGATVELVHESLIETWAKLREWLDENEQDAQFLARLRAAARPWEAIGEAEGLLWRDRAAEDAWRWLERRRAAQGAEATRGLGSREERYLLAVVALAERARRLRRRLAAGAIAAIAAIALVVSALAISAEREAARAREAASRADQEAVHAQAEARQARNATRMAAARELVADPTTELALLRELEPPDVPHGWAELARWALEEGVARVVIEHADGLHAAAWSPDGERIVTASSGKLARVWNADGTGEPIVLRGHEDRVYSAAFSPDGRRIVTASWDKTARVWNADGTGEPLILRGHENALFSAAFSPDGQRIVTASVDGTARVWNADGTGGPLILRGHEAHVMWAAFSPDGKRIVTASWDKTARVWNADGAGERLVLRGHEEGVNAADFSPDGQRIVTVGQDKTARVWKADGTGEPLVLRGHQAEIEWAAFSPDGQRIVTASSDATARIWKSDGTDEPLVLRGHRAAVSSAVFSRDGERILTASMDKTARIWNADGRGKPLVLRGHRDNVMSVAFSADGGSIVTASLDKTARVWKADGTGEPLVLREKERVFSAAFSPDGKRILTSSPDSAARVWSADGTGEPLVFRGHYGGLLWAAFSPDGKRILTAGVDRTARVWKADGTGEPVILRGHLQAITSAAWSPDGKRIVTTSTDETARVWNADGTGEPFVFRGHDAIVESAAFSPDGKRIVTGSSDETARVWNADGTGEPSVLRGHDAPVGSVAWSADGKRILTAGGKAVRVWSADGTGEILVLRGGDASFRRATFSPDGARIAAAADDGTAWVWTNIEPLSSVNDPKLWTATSYCIPIERRVALLNVPEAAARADRAACVRRVEQARAESAGGR